MVWLPLPRGAAPNDGKYVLGSMQCRASGARQRWVSVSQLCRAGLMFGRPAPRAMFHRKSRRAVGDLLCRQAFPGLRLVNRRSLYCARVLRVSCGIWWLWRTLCFSAIGRHLLKDLECELQVGLSVRRRDAETEPRGTSWNRWKEDGSGQDAVITEPSREKGSCHFVL